MKEQFPEVVDVEFTANMEQQLDGVEHGKADWSGYPGRVL